MYGKPLIRFIRRPGACLRLLGSESFHFLTHFPPGHYYSPIPSSDARLRAVDRTTGEWPPGIDLRADQQRALCRTFSEYAAEMPFSDRPADGLRYGFENSFFRHGDGVALYSMLRHFGPSRVIEVGSGHSSALMMDVNDLFYEGEIEITFVEPYPDRLASLMREADQHRYRVLEAPVQDLPITLFDDLGGDDVLFIDSSHVVKTGSDVLYLLTEVLPRLSAGVIVHIHDIFWPFEYPEPWVRSGRAWNEAYFLHAFLLHNPDFEILFWNSFLASEFPDTVRGSIPTALVEAPDPLGASNSSLWLRRT